MYKRNPLSSVNFFPFNAGNITYFYSERSALWHAAKILRFSSNDEIIVPSYNCGAEIDPLIKCGIKIKLYRIDSNLKIDFEDLNRKINHNTKAILVIHYFGFPQPVDQIRTICDKNGLFLIEDCAHALFSTCNDKPLGSSGDISVFSLKKILPIPDGGALVINNPELKQPERPLQPPQIYILNKLIANLLFSSRTLMRVSRLVSRPLKKTKLYATCSSNLYDYRIDLKQVNWEMSKVSSSIIKKIIEKGDVETIIKKRRHNFIFFLHTLKNLTNANLIFDKLQEGVCPTLFPVIVNERDRIHELLLNKGIFTLKAWQRFYPELPWHQFPEAVFFKNHVISFPIHHDVNEKDLLRAVEILQKIQ